MSHPRACLAVFILASTAFAANVPEITPPKLDDGQTIVKLPGTVSDSAVGGGGRYLIFHLKSLRQVAVFDVNQAKIVKYIPADDDDIMLTAGADKLIILLGNKSLLLRYSLTSFERELTVQCPVTRVGHMVMGSASDGPLMLTNDDSGNNVGVNANCVFLDVQKMQPIEIKMARRGHVHWYRKTPVMMSPDGRLIVASYHGSHAYRINGKEVDAFTGDSAGVLVPGPLGRYVYGYGPMTAELRPLGTPTRSSGRQCLPAVRGQYYVSMSPKGSRSSRTASTYEATLHVAGDTKPLLSAMDIGLSATQITSRDTSSLPIYKRVFFVPQANLFAVVAHTYDHLILTKFDLAKALDDSGVDYLFVSSQPPNSAVPGSDVNYQVAVKSKRGGVKYKLEAGPEGMRLSPDGLVTWKVPGTANDEANIIMAISDASGQEIFHSFKIVLSRKVVSAPGTTAVIPARPTVPRVTTKTTVPPTTTRPAIPSVRTAGTAAKASSTNVPGIQPPGLEASPMEIKLPGTISDAVVGGGGRYLILNLPSLQKLAVFDVNTAKIEKYLPASDNDIHYAAGADKLIVAFGNKKVMSRYSLKSFERELTVPLAAPVLKNLVMGSASDGPLLQVTAVGTSALDRGQYSFLDPKTLRTIDVKFEGSGRNHISYRDYMHLRASANGTLFTSWCTSHSPSGLNSLIYNGNVATTHYEHSSAGFLIPSADGSAICSSRGLYTPNLTRLGNNSGPPNAIPATHGKYYLSCTSASAVHRAVTGDKSAPKGCTLHMVGDARPLLTLTDVEMPGGTTYRRSGFDWDKHVHFVPQANLLIVIPTTEDKLVLYDLNIDEALEKSGIDYLLVTSQPPVSAQAGSRVDYQLQVKSKQGGLKYRLEAGPAGMAINSAGKLSWAIPAGVTGKQNVIVTISDAAGQEVFHTFAINVSGRVSVKTGVATVQPTRPAAPKLNGIGNVAPAKKFSAADEAKAASYLRFAKTLADRDPANARKWAEKAIESAPGSKPAKEAEAIIKKLDEAQ